nr:hypothetical protein [uncultured Mediterranean phage uvMED]
MLENGEFRQSISSTERALGFEKNSRWLNRLLVGRGGNEPKLVPPENSLQSQGFHESNAKAVPPESPMLLPVRCPGVIYHTTTAYTINLPMVIEIWKYTAKSESKHSATALELLGLSAIHSLERTYQEAFGVEDNRSTDQRLLDWSIRLEAGKHFPLFGDQFNKHFARVTGRCVGYDSYAAVCLADLVYHRLPEPIYEKLKEVNKVNPETGRREHTYAQLMTNEMLLQMREVVAAVTNQLANTASKVNDPKDYPRLLRRLDKTLPRYKTRSGSRETRGVYPPALREYNESRRKQGKDSKETQANTESDG